MLAAVSKAKPRRRQIYDWLFSWIELTFYFHFRFRQKGETFIYHSSPALVLTQWIIISYDKSLLSILKRE